MNSGTLTGITFCHTHPSYIPANHHFAPHAHPHHELVLVQQGRFRSRVDGTDTVAKRGDILLYLAGTVHEEWCENAAPVLVWACGFGWNGFEADEPLLRHDTFGRIQELLARIHHMKKTSGPRLCLSILSTLLTELKRLKTTLPDTMVERVQTYIRSNISNSLTIEELAALTGFSQGYFARWYKTHAGRTPMEDVRLLRVEEARRLITTTALPLHKIAPLVGLSNEYHLSRLLKTHLGVGVRDLRPDHH